MSIQGGEKTAQAKWAIIIFISDLKNEIGTGVGVKIEEERFDSENPLGATTVAMEEMDGEVRHGGVLSAFRYKDFALFWTGAFISNTGTWIQTAVLLWFVLQITGSNAWVGAVNVANYMPVLLFVRWHREAMA